MSGQSNYSAVFDITITNDSVYDFSYSTPVYTHTINRLLNGESIDTSYLHYEINGISTGSIIESKTNVTFRVTFTFTDPLSDDQYDTFIVDGDFEPTVTENKISRIYADVKHNTEGNLRGENTSAAYTIKIMSTYDTQKTFTVSIDSDKFDIKDANMNSPVQYSVASNESEATYTFYLVKKQGTTHMTDTERVGVIVNVDGQDPIYAGRVVALVDQNSYYKDENAPLISNVTSSYTTNTGELNVSWSGRDLETYVESYTVIAYRDNTEISRKNVSANETSCNFSGLSNGSYYFVVIGTDKPGNTATNSEITSATQAEGHASRSVTTSYEWSYTISFNLTNCQNKQNATVYKFTDYTTTIQPNKNYVITDYSITVGGATMSSSGYSLNGNNNSLTIYGDYITGNIVVTVTATRQNGGVCGN